MYYHFSEGKNRDLIILMLRTITVIASRKMVINAAGFEKHSGLLNASFVEQARVESSYLYF